MNQLVTKKQDGTPVLILVLEPGNLHKIRTNQPIKIRVQDMFPDGIPKRLELVISYSETPVADAREIARESQLSIDERAHVTQKLRPHCPECKSTIEELGVWKSESPVILPMCAQCGCVLGAIPNTGQFSAAR